MIRLFILLLCVSSYLLYSRYTSPEHDFISIVDTPRNTYITNPTLKIIVDNFNVTEINDILMKTTLINEEYKLDTIDIIKKINTYQKEVLLNYTHNILYIIKEWVYLK